MTQAAPRKDPEAAALPVVSLAAKVPLYQQIFLILRDQIMSGTYNAGDVLPSEFELGRIYGVSRITAKQALAELAAAGLAKRYRGKGTVVSDTPKPPPLRASVSDWMNFTVTMGRRTKVRVIDMTEASANSEEAAALRLEEGAPVCRWLRVRLHHDQPFSVLRVVVPGAVGAGIGREDLETTPLLDLLQARGHRIGEAQQVITATLADQSLAALLELDVGSPLLKVIRIVHDAAGAPVEYLTAFYRPDRYQLEIVLSSENKLLKLGDPSQDIFRKDEPT
ncbi:GntR family transcriptional regulator [Gemmobacter sp.]|uniref:GntR family transcriptional regulator n=1 Tax=Gemmobacter sp. TaxID=1898957 RepID=UPI002AFF2066|nr:GntR family transcriptional regulator [Gemmobacter sp.]